MRAHEQACAFRILDSLQKMQIITDMRVLAGFFLECRLMIERQEADDLVEAWWLCRLLAQ